jgi:hypothetical protein
VTAVTAGGGDDGESEHGAGGQLDLCSDDEDSEVDARAGTGTDWNDAEESPGGSDEEWLEVGGLSDHKFR